MTQLVQVVFGVLAAFALFGAVMVVSVRNLIHAALWLIATFFAMAAIYLLMQAEFLSFAQVLIYVGAVSILILFAIMLTRDVEGEHTQLLVRHWWAAGIVAAALFGLLIVPAVYNNPWQIAAAGADGAPPPIASTVQIGTAFLREYLLPFEVASVLLLVALVGAIVIAFEQPTLRRRVLTLAEEVAQRRSQNTEYRIQNNAVQSEEHEDAVVHSDP